MNRFLRGIVLVFGVGIPLGVVGFFVGARYVGPTPVQHLALLRLTAPTPPVKGRDASDAAWLLGLDVPVARRVEVAAKVRRFEQQRDAPGTGRRDPRLEWPRYPDPPEGGDGVCEVHEPGCLAYVSENRALVAAALDAHRDGVDAARALASYDGYRIGVAISESMQYPMYTSYRRLVISDYALRFASGEQLSAVEATCRDLAGWRRVAGNSDDLVLSMVGVSWVRQDAMLLADMLAKLPKETELPADCLAAMQASENFEYDLCPSMRREFAAQRQAREQFLRESSPDSSERHLTWAIDWNHFEAMVAEDMGPFCEPALLLQLRADRKASEFLPPPPQCLEWRRIADYFGCAFFGSGRRAGFGKFLDRRADQAQVIALLRTIVWLRKEAASKDEVAAALARRPKELGLLRAPAYDLDLDQLSIPLHDTSHGESFVLAAGAEPRPTRRHRICCTRRASGRTLAMLD